MLKIVYDDFGNYWCMKDGKCIDIFFIVYEKK